MKLLSLVLLAVGLSVGSAVFAADAAATKPAMACCGEKCAAMANCCKQDDAGKASCSMGGACCVKPATTPAK